jgi:low affinity Fe/Cu permease
MARQTTQFGTGEPELMNDRFHRYATRLTEAVGSVPALVASILLVVGWALAGPIFNFSDTWQLFINTTTTVITFWMVFVIQSSANRDAKAIHLKLDEIIRATQGARNSLITLEAAPEAVVERTARELVEVAEREVQDADEAGTPPAGTPPAGTPASPRASRRTPAATSRGQRGTSSDT